MFCDWFEIGIVYNTQRDIFLIGFNKRGKGKNMISEQSVVPYKYSETRIYFSDSSGDFSGYIEHASGKKTWKFGNVMEMLALHESLFSNIGYPQMSCEVRSLDDSKEAQTKETSDISLRCLSKLPSGLKPSFIVNVLFRQNASWQGTIQWVDGKKTQSFRSTLEMIKLISDALPEDSGDKIATWESAK